MHTDPRVARCGCPATVLALACLPLGLLAQAAPAARGDAAATYLERHAEVARLAPVRGQVADINHLVLNRDVARLTLERGRLYLLSPVGGRTVGAVFRGEGRFRFAPELPAEQAALRRFADSTQLDVPITEVVLLFADSTSAAIGRLAFGPADIPGDVADHARDLIRSLTGEHEGSFDSEVMGPLLNGDTAGFFLAQVRRARGDPILLQVSQGLAESVALYRQFSRRATGVDWLVVSQFPAQSQSADDARSWRYRQRLRTVGYRLDVRLTELFNANLSLAAAATVILVAREPVGPWLRFRLDPRLDVDSARWGGGERAGAFKADDDGVMWVRAPRAPQPGDTLALTVFYRGTLIDRYGDWFFVDPLTAWYPVNAQGEGAALFDITYHSPARYPLISTGERVDSTLEGTVLTTHWVSRIPAVSATFNLGLFDAHHVQNPGAPALDVFLSEDAHRILARALARQGTVLLEQRNMSASVAADISNSLALFTSLYGESPFQHYYITEIPYPEGVSFPGMIDLSWGTFQNTSTDGFDEFFRAHEASHQWWGNGVRPATYRDAWLSEGLATFSGLLYLQTARRHNDEYYRFLDAYQEDILEHRDQAGPLWIGYRNTTMDTPRGYDVIVYEKGAWVFHMLRLMMLDLSTLRAERFTATLRDYYQAFHGGTASTEEFQAVVEDHLGVSLAWFFDQWVRGTAIPTYHVAWTSQPADGGRFRVRLRVTQEHVSPDFRMPVLVAVDLGGNRTARFRLDVNGGRTEYTSPLLPGEPRGVVFNEFHSVLAEVRTERW